SSAATCAALVEVSVFGALQACMITKERNIKGNVFMDHGLVSIELCTKLRVSGLQRNVDGVALLRLQWSSYTCLNLVWQAPAAEGGVVRLCFHCFGCGGLVVSRCYGVMVLWCHGFVVS